MIVPKSRLQISSNPLYTSVSYCGKSGRLYPDKKPMGFPFERSFSYKTLTDLVKEVPNRWVFVNKVYSFPGQNLL